MNAWNDVKKPHKGSLDYVSSIAPAIDMFALATAEIPVLGEIVGAVAIAATAASVIDGLWTVKNDVTGPQPASGFKTGLDVAGTLLAAVGLGAGAIGKLGMGAALSRRVESAADVEKATSKAAKMPRSFKRVAAEKAARAGLENAKAAELMGKAVNMVTGTLSDGITEFENGFNVTCLASAPLFRERQSECRV